jgi:hypothetical protein
VPGARDNMVGKQAVAERDGCGRIEGKSMLFVRGGSME